MKYGLALKFGLVAVTALTLVTGAHAASDKATVEKNTAQHPTSNINPVSM